MLRISFTAGLLLATICGPALAQSSANGSACYNDQVSNSGALIIRMGSGQIFKAYPGSAGKLATWLPLDKVKICPLGGASYEITNLSNNRQVKALRQ
jgi:hypothetical protein